ncbi:MAG TPA: DUF998 domain-containing protein [Ignavibacteriales bacterium]|nr:DUF998 domain-containing protein [Ignavibacteriales bacterium]
METAALSGRKELFSETVLRVLLICGILYPIVYAGADIIGNLVYAGYDYTSQNISEILAIGSPARPVVLPLFNLSDLLLLAFSVGVYESAGDKRVLRAAAVLLICCALTGSITAIFSPMNLRDAPKTYSDKMHIALTGVLVIFILGAIGTGAAAFGKRFRQYSIITIVVLLIFGALTGMQGPKIGTGVPTPWMGITERVNIYGYAIWVLFFAVSLLRRAKNKESPEQA